MIISSYLVVYRQMGYINLFVHLVHISDNFVVFTIFHLIFSKLFTILILYSALCFGLFFYIMYVLWHLSYFVSFEIKSKQKCELFVFKKQLIYIYVSEIEQKRYLDLFQTSCSSFFPIYEYAFVYAYFVQKLGKNVECCTE